MTFYAPLGPDAAGENGSWAGVTRFGPVGWFGFSFPFLKQTKKPPLPRQKQPKPSTSGGCRAFTEEAPRKGKITPPSPEKLYLFFFFLKKVVKKTDTY